jgi:superkiller protein 3
VTIRHLLALFVVLLGSGAALAQQQDGAAQDPAALVRDGDFYMDRGDCALAQYFYEEALGLAPDDVDALVGAGRALRCQGRLTDAVDALRRAVDLSGDGAEPLVQLALTYREQYLSDPNAYATRLGDALDVVTRAERTAPDDAKVLNTKGVILYQNGDLGGARTAFERAAEEADRGGDLTNRERSTIRVNLGPVYRDADEMELARRTFQRAVVLDPTNADAHNLLGNAHFRLGDCDAAEYELSQAVTLAPSSLSAVSQLGITLFECGDAAASLPVLERALELEGAVFTPPLYTYLARAYLDAGRIDEALRRAQQGALLPPESAEAHYWLGQVYQARGADGDVQAARDAYGRALELRPGYGDARRALDALP